MTIKVQEWKDGWNVVAHRNRTRRTRKFESEHEARSFAEELTAFVKVHGDEGMKLMDRKRPNSYTLKAWAVKWIKEMRASSRKQSTIDRYESSINTHLVPYFGRLDITQIERSLLKEFCLEKQEANSKHGVRLMVAAMRAMMKEALMDGLIQKNPATELGQYFGTGTEGRSDKMPLTKAELKRLLETIRFKWPEYYEFVLRAARTGMSLGEQRALQWGDIDFQKGTIHITRSWSYGRPITTPKTKARIRKIDMSPELRKSLLALRSRRKAEALAEGRTRILKWVPVQKGPACPCSQLHAPVLAPCTEAGRA